MRKLNKFVKLCVPLALGLAFCSVNTSAAEASRILPAKADYGSGSGKSFGHDSYNYSSRPSTTATRAGAASMSRGFAVVGSARASGANFNTYKKR